MRKGIRFFSLMAAAGLVSAGAALSADAAMTRSSMQKLAMSGKSMTCSFSREQSGSAMTGTMYISRGKVRGDFTTDGHDSHMIRTEDKWVYMWGGPMGAARGTKMRTDAVEKQNPQLRHTNVDADEEMDLDCREWREDSSKFVVPANVEFSDMTEQMNRAVAAMQRVRSSGMPARTQGMQGLDMQAMKCQACDQAPAGPERDQCKKMMGCA